METYDIFEIVLLPCNFNRFLHHTVLVILCFSKDSGLGKATPAVISTLGFTTGDYM
jgi:hypothetical protein